VRAARPIVVCAALAIAIASTTLVGPAAANAGVTKTVKTLAPGLTLTRISDPKGPFKIRVLTVDPKRVTLDVALAGKTFSSFTQTSKMARNDGAIAAINGDFWTYPSGPIHPFADDGSLIDSGTPGTNFAVSKDALHLHMGHASPTVKATVVSSGATFRIDKWNAGKPGANQIAGYTPIGGSVDPPPASACSARLLPTGPATWATGRAAVDRDYKVDAVACQSSAMPLGGGVIVAAKRSSATAAVTIRSLVPGSTITLAWTMGWADVSSTIGGSPLLVDKGKVVPGTNCGSWFCDRNPRTGIGYTAVGKVLLVTVDGRQPGWSAGMTLVEFAKEMIKLGAVKAVNLDGGGSTTMWTKSSGLVNRPAEWSGERAVGSAVLVLRAPEPGALAGARESLEAAGPGGGLATLTAWQAMASDPGSTGGLLDALAGGAFGDSEPLPASFLRIAKQFRASVAR
jgi:hypothetical protein